MSVPVLENGSAGVANAELKPGSFVSLRAECNVLAVLSNCPQMHNPCNGYNPSPIKVSIAQDTVKSLDDQERTGDRD